MVPCDIRAGTARSHQRVKSTVTPDLRNSQWLRGWQAASHRRGVMSRVYAVCLLRSDLTVSNDGNFRTHTFFLTSLCRDCD